MFLVCRQINEMKQEEYQKKIALKIMLLDVGNHTSSVSAYIRIQVTDISVKCNMIIVGHFK